MQKSTFHASIKSYAVLFFFVLLFPEIINGDAFRNHCAHRNTKEYLLWKLNHAFVLREK
jgi:hypothetical protein